MFLTIIREKSPHVSDDHRYEIKNLMTDDKKGSIVSVSMHFGYMEDLDVETQLDDLAVHKKIHLDDDHTKWLIHAMHERVYPGVNLNMFQRLRFALFKLLQRVANTADQYFHLGNEVPLSIEVVPVHFGK
jgi:K+ transporter